MNWRIVVVTGALALLGASCGDDDPPLSSPETTSTASVSSQSAAATTTTVPADPTPAADGPSQSAQDAQRDGVLAEIAALPHDVRVRSLVEVDAAEGSWVLSRIGEAADGSPPTVLGDPEGEYATDFVATFEYGEILLVDDSGQIASAYPMPGAIPSWIVLTDDAVFAGRIGDGGLPDSTAVRIDRRTFDADVLLMPAPFDGGSQWPTDWVVATVEEAAIHAAAVGFAPDGAVGAPAMSWIGEVMVDLDAMESLFASSLGIEFLVLDAPDGMLLTGANVHYALDGAVATADYGGPGRFVFVSSAVGSPAAAISETLAGNESDDVVRVATAVAGAEAVMLVGEAMLPNSGPHPHLGVYWPGEGRLVHSVLAYGEFSEEEVVAMAEALVPVSSDTTYRVSVADNAEGVGRVRLAASSGQSAESEFCLTWEHGTGSGSGCFDSGATGIIVRQGILVGGLAVEGEHEVVLRDGDGEFAVPTYPTPTDGVRVFALVHRAPESVELT